MCKICILNAKHGFILLIKSFCVYLSNIKKEAMYNTAHPRVSILKTLRNSLVHSSLLSTTKYLLLFSFVKYEDIDYIYS